MASKRIIRTSHPALVGIDYTSSFAISYDEPVCGVCRSKMVIHRIESHNWSFACAMCRAEIDREVMNMVEGWHTTKQVEIVIDDKTLPQNEEADILD
jgi:hypothetical protein